MDKKTDYLNLTSPCGLDCFNCPLYLANKNDKLRKLISEKINVPYEKTICKGCRSMEGKIDFLHMSETCKIFKCCNDKKIKFCFECDDFPCDHLHPYADKASKTPQNTKIFNSCLIKKLGLEKWADEKADEVRSTYFKGKFKLF